MLTGFKAVPHHHETIPGSHDMFDYGFFDTRFYKTVQVYEQENSNPSKTAHGDDPVDRELTLEQVNQTFFCLRRCFQQMSQTLRIGTSRST